MKIFENAWKSFRYLDRLELKEHTYLIDTCFRTITDKFLLDRIISEVKKIKH